MTGITKQDPLISVIIPIYKVEQYLRMCVDSVLNQSYRNLEILLVDDGSPDDCPTICDEYMKKDSRIIVVHKENGGVSSARNIGIDICHGDYILFLDADDELKPRCIEVLFNNLIDNNADISACRPTHHKYEWKYESNMVIWRGKEALIQSITDNPLTYAVWAKLYKRDIIGNLRFDISLRVNEDSFFLFQVCCRQPVFVSTEQKLYVYHITPLSASRNQFSEKYRDTLIVAQRKYTIIEKDYPNLIYLAKNVLIKAKMNYLEILCNRTGKEYIDEERRLIKEICQNRKYYISASKANDKWLFIICHHLYFIYKFTRKVIL